MKNLVLEPDQEEKIAKLIEEINCLRSVLAEWEDDKDCYIMFNRAENLRMERERKSIV